MFEWTLWGDRKGGVHISKQCLRKSGTQKLIWTVKHQVEYAW